MPFHYNFRSLVNFNKTQIFGENHINIAALLARLGMLYGNRDNKGNDLMLGTAPASDQIVYQQKAREMLRRAYEIREAKLGADHHLTKGNLDFQWVFAFSFFLACFGVNLLVQKLKKTCMMLSILKRLLRENRRD